MSLSSNADIGVVPVDVVRPLSGLEFMKRLSEGRISAAADRESDGFSAGRGRAGPGRFRGDAGRAALQPQNPIIHLHCNFEFSELPK